MPYPRDLYSYDRYSHQDHHGSHEYPSSHDLADRLAREARHSHRPVRYIVNDGQLVINERTIRNSNAVIYNSPGSSMSLEPSRRRSSSASYAPVVHRSHHHHQQQYQSPSSSPSAWLPATPSVSTCRGCFERREICYGSYCRDCASTIMYGRSSSRRLELPRDSRRSLIYPERRLISW